MRHVIGALCGAILVTALAGCSRPTATSMTLPGEAYPAALDAARQTLRDNGFTINRVDAAAGVITTHPKATAGLATPWDGEQSSMYQEWEDFMNRHRRTVRINFAPAGEAGGAAPEGDPTDLAELAAAGAPLTMVTTVGVERSYRSNWQIESSSIRQSRRYWDRELASRGMTTFSVPIAQDEKLAARLTEAVRRRLGLAQGE